MHAWVVERIDTSMPRLMDIMGTYMHGQIERYMEAWTNGSKDR